MKEEINISNSRLNLVRLKSVSKDGKSVIEFDKTKLKYQEAYVILPDGVHKIMLHGFGDFEFPVDGEVWCIENSKIKFGKVDYSSNELKVIASVITGLLMISEKVHLDTVEILVRAFNNNELLKAFNESYGDFSEFIDLLNTSDSLGDLNENSPKNYTGNRYSIYRLAKDLISDKAQIYIEPELLRTEYSRISPKVFDKSKPLVGKWCNIITKSGNKTRANLNLVYQAKVEVEIPENEYGVEPGKRELDSIRSLCIVKDGALWFPKIAVRVHNTYLRAKLNRIKGLVEGTVVRENELLLDLSAIPVISRKDLISVTTWNISRELAEYEMDKVALHYLSVLKYSVGKSGAIEKELVEKYGEDKELDDKEKYLHSLGIYGDRYIAPKTTTRCEGTYISKCILGVINGLPSDSVKSIKKYLTTGKCTNKQLLYIISRIDTTKHTIDEYVEYYEKDKKKRVSRIHDVIFRSIMGKTLNTFDSTSEEYKPAEEVKVKVKWSIKDQVIEY